MTTAIGSLSACRHVCTHHFAVPTQRSLAVALALALGASPLAGMAANLVVVTTAGDNGSSGTCNLRQAIQTIVSQSTAGTNCAFAAASADTIHFDTGVFPNGATNTITLTDADTSALQLSDANVTIDANANGTVAIERSSAASHAFGIFEGAGGTVTLRSLTIRNGFKFADGGGIAVSYENLTLDHCLVSGNFAVFGGGIEADHSSLTLTHSAVSGNTGQNDGGGIRGLLSSITLTNSSVSGNTAQGNVGAGLGGGIEAINSDVTMTGSTVDANTAGDGGAILSHLGSVTLTNSTLSGNTATSLTGGAIDSTADPGNSITLINSTVSANTSNYAGGGIYRVAYAGADPAIKVVNSIIAGNSATTQFNDTNAPLTADSSGNIIGGDAKLGALADNGGPTRTMMPSSGSPAIDAVPCTNAPATDQRGITRPQGASCDIGAVEFVDVIFKNGFDGP